MPRKNSLRLNHTYFMLVNHGGGNLILMKPLKVSEPFATFVQPLVKHNLLIDALIRKNETEVHSFHSKHTMEPKIRSYNKWGRILLFPHDVHGSSNYNVFMKNAL